MAFDLDEAAVRLRLQLLHERVELGLRLVRHHRPAELEVPLVFAQDDFVDEPLGRLLDGVGLGRGLAGGGVGLVGPAARGLRCCLRPLVDLGDLAFVGARPLLGLFDRASERVDLVVHLADFGPHVLLRCARGGAPERERDDRNRYDELLHHVLH